IFAQPFVCSTDYGSLVIVHNGNITNTLNLSEKNYESDSDFIVEFLGNLINEFRGDIKAAVLKFVEKVDGSYSIIGMLNDEIFSFRDPRGIRPLVIGSNGKITVVASESVVLQNMRIEDIDTIKPGELVFFSNNKWKREILSSHDHAHCMFEYVYFANPCSIIENKLVYDVRLQLGRELGNRIKNETMIIDYIIPVPDTSRPQIFAENLHYEK
ncbi:MAG: hypothetical protein ACXABJ_10905, partial [Candidatus Heimdallarchaeaceae archaeon]